MPGAVLRSRTTGDIAAMIRLRREHDIPVAVLAAAGLRFAAGLTGYVPLTIGGRLSAGGIGGNFATGARVDHIRRIEVVTGGGEIVPASERDNRDLFDAALGGLGQGGVITCAELEVEPLPTAVHSWVLPVTDASAAFDHMRAPIGGSGVDEVYCMILPPGAALPDGTAQPGPTFLVHAAAYDHGESTAPRDAPAQYRTVSYREHVPTSSAVIDRWRQAGWDERRKPAPPRCSG